ncbi:MFS transporter [Actinomycetospora callitridis]|uniref:MFS transporter n=1 Tax=Actinomycetospora callitridis TaxID=913944 RepID=UPI0023660E37|nr:MFS transporter [Actinomycetospora callitridis]MDD7921771.1 MFS transporter [Actinomycetospora callitridis]
MTTSPTTPPVPGAAATAGDAVVDPATGRPAGRAQLILLLAASCMSVLGAVLIAPVLPQIQAEFAAVAGVEVLVPIVLTVPALIIGLMAPFAGAIADRFDRKRLLLVAMVGYTIFGTAPLYLGSLGAILGSRVLVGVCEAAIMTCATTLIGDYWSGEQRSRYLGLQTLVATLSATVFLGLGGALGAAGWRTPFWLYFAAILLVVPMARSLWQPARPTAEARTGARLAGVPWRRLAAPCLVTLFGGAVFYALIVELSFVLNGLGVTSTAVIGGISAVMSLATAAGAIVFGRISRLSPRVLLPTAFGLSAVGLVVVFATTSLVVVTLGAVITGFGTGMLLPTLLTWAVNRLSFEQRGRGTGLWTGSLFLGEFLAPLVIAGIGVGVGGLQPALAVLGVAAAVMAVVTWLALRGRDEPLNTGHL